MKETNQCIHLFWELNKNYGSAVANGTFVMAKRPGKGRNINLGFFLSGFVIKLDKYGGGQDGWIFEVVENKR